jgi:hypothetical protein
MSDAHACHQLTDRPSPDRDRRDLGEEPDRAEGDPELRAAQLRESGDREARPEDDEMIEGGRDLSALA